MRGRVGRACVTWGVVSWLLAGALGLTPAIALSAANDYPYLSWQDEFDGASIERARWTYDLGTGSQYGLTGWGNNELQYYTDYTRNASVGNGMLSITARQEKVGGQDYTSARLKTEGLFSQAGGRFEIRAALPTGQGIWPALWMMPTSSTYGGWASSGEIDIMEARGQEPSRVEGTIHYGGSWPGNTWSSSSYTFPAGQTIAGFHTYALEWDFVGSPAIRWYVDGTLFATKTSWWSSGGAYPAPFNQPFHLIMNVAVGGNYVGSPNQATSFPRTMLVDYVRAYTAAPPTISLPVVSGTLTQGQFGHPTIAAAASVTKTGSGAARMDAANSYSGPTRVQAGTLTLMHPRAVAQSVVEVSPGARVTLGDGMTVTAAGLTLASGGRVDVGTARLEVSSGWTAVSARDAVAAARGDGSWTGTSGIGSGVVTSAVARGLSRAVGWVDDGHGGISFAATAPGDLNLDCTVDLLDAAAFIAAGAYDRSIDARWQDGDATFDGVVDSLDVAEFIATGLFDTGPIGFASATMVVPEPDWCWPVIVALAGLVRRRRR